MFGSTGWHDQALFCDLCECVWYCYGIHSLELRQLLNCPNGPYNPSVAEAGTFSQVVHVGVLFDLEFVRQRLSPQLLRGDSICESNEKEQRPDVHVHKDDESGPVQKSRKQSDWALDSHLHDHHDHNLRFHPCITLLFLLFLTFPCPSRTATTTSAANCMHSLCSPGTTTETMAALWMARVLTDSARVDECLPSKNARKERVVKESASIARGKRTASLAQSLHRLPTTMSMKGYVSGTIWLKSLRGLPSDGKHNSLNPSPPIPVETV